MSDYFAGLDLGQSADPSALVIAKRFTHWLPAHDERGQQKSVTVYHVVHLERLPLHTPYPLQVHRVQSLLARPPLQGAVTVALDYTGVGRPVFDMFTDATLSCPLYGVTIHGGDTVTQDGVQIRVPKRDLIAVTSVLLQSGRLKIADRVPDATLLAQEMQNFRIKIDPVTAHDSYSAWRESQHDDLVLATALALW